MYSQWLVWCVCLHSAQAERVSDNINITKEALESSQAAIKKAEDEMDTALENLNTAQNITNTVQTYMWSNEKFVFDKNSWSDLINFLSQVDNKLLNLNNSQMDVMMRLANLSHAVELLRNKTEQNREMAKDAKAQSVNATLEAAGLQEVCVLYQLQGHKSDT